MTDKSFEENRAVGPLDLNSKQASLRVWKSDDERSLIRLVPERIRQAMLELPDDLKNLEEADLRKRYKFLPIDNQIRMSFWLEYNRVQDQWLDKMTSAHIIRGITSDEFFYECYLHKPERVAWMITPPVAHTAKLKELVEFGYSKIREMMDLPISEEVDDPKTGKKKTKIDHRVANLIMRATAMMDMRMNGGIKQQLEVKGGLMTLDLKGDAKDVMKQVQLGNMDELNKRLEFLEKKEKMIEKGVHPGNMHDVISVEHKVLGEDQGETTEKDDSVA